jgi:curved DNA-binding protein CbpA
VAKSTLYEILGIAESATAAEIAKAWQDIKEQNQPEATRGSHDAANRLKFAHQAYAVLGNPITREEYDRRTKLEKARAHLAATDEAKAAQRRANASTIETMPDDEPRTRLQTLTHDVRSGTTEHLHAWLLLAAVFGFVLAVPISLLITSDDGGSAAPVGASLGTAIRGPLKGDGRLAELKETALAAVQNELFDPFAAQFRDLYEVRGVSQGGEPKMVVCGEVNSKNRFGGYVGWTRWVYFDGEVHMDGPDELAALAFGVYERICSADAASKVDLP